MSVAEMSEHQGGAGKNLGRLYKCYNDGIHTRTCIEVDKYDVQSCPIASWLITPHGLCIAMNKHCKYFNKDRNLRHWKGLRICIFSL